MNDAAASSRKRLIPTDGHGLGLVTDLEFVTTAESEIRGREPDRGRVREVRR